MAMIELKHVHRVTTKGRTYIYAWRGGPRILADSSDTVAFVAELQAAHEAHRFGDTSKLAFLITSYKASDAWQAGLSAKTRQNWAPWLDRIGDKFGQTTLAAFDRPLMKVAIRKWRDTFKAHPRSADMGMQTFSRVLSFGMEEGLLSTNACAKLSKLYRNDRSAIIWTDDDLAGLAKTASPEIVWAAKLAALTGLRQADCLRLSWSHVKPLSIEIKTGKSNQRKTTLIPIYSELRAVLESIPRRATTVLTNQDKLPWRSGFGSSWGKATAKAGIDKHFHDLRGTAATKFYLSGLSIREIAEIMTWSEEAVEGLLDIYVKKDELLLDRIRRMDENEGRTAGVKLPVKPSAPG